jgi:type II secretion system protein E
MKELAAVLLEMGAVTREQLTECQALPSQTLEQCLLEAKLVSFETLARAYGLQYGTPYIEVVTEAMADPLLLARFPLKFLRDNVVLPIKLDGNVAVLTSNPRNFQPIDELNLILGNEIGLAIASAKTIVEGINRFYPLEGAKEIQAELEEEKGLTEEEIVFGAIEEAEITGRAEEAPIIKLVNHILYQAVKQGASDIHIEPYEKEVHVRYRIDGVMHLALTPPKRAQAALTSRIKIMADMNIAEKRKPQDGRIMVKVADKPYDIRVSLLPVQFGERIVMRLLDKSKAFVALEKFGFSERDLKVLSRGIARPNGIILVSGPTGSGKTTTLYAVLAQLNKPDVNIMTVEDPVEYQMPNVAQIQVMERIGLTFAVALRSILRQDPDIIMIGEMRDQETAQISIQAALTGHLVLSTIHTNNAPATITRLLDMGIEPFLIASTLVVIIAQRLVRTLCPACKVVYKPSEDLIESLGLTKAEGEKITFYKEVGCAECNNTGFRGRAALFEIMEITPEIAHLTMQRSDASLIRRQAIADGMTLLIQDGIRRIRQGQTTIEEVLSAAVAEEPGERDLAP